jgi:mono/diheme cytochrome c family protein
MPTFGLDDNHLNVALDYFSAVSNTIGPFRTHDDTIDSSVIRSGGELFELLRCQQCHVLGSIPEGQSVDNLAPDLRMSRERLQPDWILDWLMAPLEIQPGTRMPMFWTEYPDSFYPQFEADAAQQIAAVRDYLLTFRGGPSPLPSN